MKFKASIRELQNRYGPKHTIVTISAEAQSEIDKIDLALKQSNDLQHLFEAHFNEIDDTIANAKTQINAEIDTIIKALQNRKKSLHQKVIDTYTRNCGI